MNVWLPLTWKINMEFRRGKIYGHWFRLNDFYSSWIDPVEYEYRWKSTGLELTRFFRKITWFSMPIFRMREKYSGTYSMSSFNLVQRKSSIRFHLALVTMFPSDSSPRYDAPNTKNLDFRSVVSPNTRYGISSHLSRTSTAWGTCVISLGNEILTVASSVQSTVANSQFAEVFFLSFELQESLLKLIAISSVLARESNFQPYVHLPFHTSTTSSCQLSTLRQGKREKLWPKITPMNFSDSLPTVLTHEGPSLLNCQDPCQKELTDVELRRFDSGTKILLQRLPAEMRKNFLGGSWLQLESTHLKYCENFPEYLALDDPCLLKAFGDQPNSRGQPVSEISDTYDFSTSQLSGNSSCKAEIRPIWNSRNPFKSWRSAEHFGVFKIALLPLDHD